MPDDPTVWIVAILVGGVVVILALVLGGVVEVGLDPLRLSFRRKKDPGREQVSVLEETEIEEAEVGDVTGVERRAGGDSEESNVRDISVARGAKIKGGKIGDISGVRIAARDETEQMADPGKKED